MVTLARLHAALDSVVETEVLIATIHETSPGTSPAVTRLAEVVREAKGLLRSMLTRPDRRQLSDF
ncbi:MAG TPA: hypothetical protein VGC41_23345 [Kofleriaceae bacterium]